MTMTSMVGFPATKINIPKCSSEDWFQTRALLKDVLDNAEAEVTTPNYDYQDKAGTVSIIIMDSHDNYKMHILETLDEKGIKWETKLVKVSRPIASWSRSKREGE